MRALVVDDEPLIRMCVRDLLEEAGFECEEAADVAEALALLDSGGQAPDILVTDLNLGPGPDGIALAAAARRRLPGLPVLNVTANPEQFEGHPLGPRQRVLAKPFAAAELVAAVRELVAPGRTLPAAPARGPGALSSARRDPATVAAGAGAGR